MHPTHAEFDAILEYFLGQRIPGQSRQDPYVQSITKKYKIGSRLQTSDGLVWHYGRAGATGCPNASYGKRGQASVLVPVGSESLATIGAVLAGATQVVINDTGSLANRPEDYFENGFLTLHPSGAGVWLTDQCRKIKSSTPGNDTSITLTLYQPLTLPIPDGTTLELARSPYSEVDNIVALAHQSFLPFVGIPWMLVTPLYYHWLMTWGYCEPGFSGDPCHVAGVRDGFFARNDGSITCENDVNWVAGCQRAGVIIGDTFGAPLWTTSQPHLILQLDP